MISIHRLAPLFLAVLLALLLPSLNAFAQDAAPPADSPSLRPMPGADDKPAAVSNYLLQNNDLVRITVFQEDDLTTEARISKAGSIMFPLLGPIQLTGKTVAQAQEEIRQKLDKDYIIHPDVTLSVLEYSEIRVSVLGEVQKPGIVDIPPEGGLDLLGAIAATGGYTPDADSAHVTVRRQVDGREVVLSVDATELARNSASAPFMMKADDAVTVPYVKKWVTVLGEVQKPGKIVLPTEGDLDLLGAIALASGYTPDADPTKVEVRRTLNGQDVVIPVNATELARDSKVKAFILQPGDSITVHYAQTWITVIGEVQKPGQVRIPPEGGLDLLGAVALAGGFDPNADLARVSVRRTIGGRDIILNVDAKKLSHDSHVEAFMMQPGDSITVPQRMF
jgi:polysaccharide export outer membrane protein